VYEDELLELEPMPYIVLVVDEVADLMMISGKEIEGAVQRPNHKGVREVLLPDHGRE
jgi:DNA segregation ATPase FtsK/SpoIIIE-like protein